VANLKLAIPGAIGARVATAVTKPTAAGIAGSSAMLSDGVHPAVDTFYGVLLRLFIEAGSAPPQQRWSRPDAVRLPVDAPTTCGRNRHCRRRDRPLLRCNSVAQRTDPDALCANHLIFERTCL